MHIINPKQYNHVHHEGVPALAPASVSSGDSSYSSSNEEALDVSSSSSCDPALPKVIEASRRVTFGEVNFRSYPVILGDHPDCLGPPLAFDWDFVREEHYDLEEYEAGRAPRKHDEGLILDWFLRKRILRCYAGVSEDDINESGQECSIIRKQREQTRKAVSFKSGMRHALSRITGGVLGDKSLKHKDRGVHINRMMQKPCSNLGAARQEIKC